MWLANMLCYMISAWADLIAKADHRKESRRHLLTRNFTKKLSKAMVIKPQKISTTVSPKPIQG